MGLGRQFRRQDLKKEWTSFEEISGLQERLDLTDDDIISMCCSRCSFYRWKKKGKAPLNTISIVREELARFYKKQYDDKINLIYNEREN
jgi:hypothetical protein